MSATTSTDSGGFRAVDVVELQALLGLPEQAERAAPSCGGGEAGGGVLLSIISRRRSPKEEDD